MIRWLRHVVPPLAIAWWWLALYVGPYLLLLFFLPWFAQGEADRLLERGDYQALAEAIRQTHYHEVLLGAFTVFYGVWRAVAFSPVYRGRYGRWLLTTPWNVGQPLPMGPRHLVPQDGIILAALTSLAVWQSDPDPMYVLVAFGISYLALLALELRSLGEKTSTFFLAFALGLIALGWEQSLVLLAIMAGMYGVAHVSLRNAMARFLWERDPRNDLSVGRRGDTPIVWPYSALRLDPPGPIIDWIDGIGVSLLAGWWLWVALYVQPPLPGEVIELTRTLQGLGFFIAAGRVGLYMLTRLPPISLRGRFATRRWIIPSYDQVFLAPLAMMGVASSFPMIARWAGISPGVYLPLGATSVLLIALNAGPMIKRWELVGEHRAYAGSPPVS